MANTPRTIDYLLTKYADNVPNYSLDQQLIRDLIVSINRLFELYTSPSYDNDAAAEAGGVQLGNVYRNGNFVMVRLS